MLCYNPKLKPRARQLRKEMTEAERLLWSRIRRKQLKNLQFYRQRIIGQYIVDFYCPQAKLVIELDGEQHYTDAGRGRDKIRDNYLSTEGLKVLHFTNKEILENINGVVEYICGYL